MNNKRIHVILSVLIIFFTLHCYEDAERNNLNDPHNFNPIYPANGKYGENLLKEGSVSISIGTKYSFCIQKTGNNKVTVFFPVNTSFHWQYNIIPNPVIGWDLAPGSGYGVFTAEGPGFFDAQIEFNYPATGGYGEIEIYKDDSGTPARTVILSW